MKKTGIKKTYFVNDIVGVRENGEDKLPEDRFRLENGLFWEKTGDQISISRPERIEFKKDTSDRGDIFIAANQDIINFDAKFVDIVFDVYLPYNKSFANRINTLTNISTLEVESFSKRNSVYERFVDSSGIDELDLLNYYVYVSRDIKKNDDIENIISNGQQIDPKLLDSEGFSGQYFKEYALTFPKWAGEYRDKYKDKIKKIVLDRKDADLFVSNNSKKLLFSKYIKLNLLKDSSAEIAKSLSDTRMNLRFLSHVLSTEAARKDVSFFSKTEYVNFVPTDGRTRTDGANFIVPDADGITTEYVSLVGNETLPYTDYLRWVKRSISNRETSNSNRYFDFSENSNALFIGKNENSEIPSNNDNIFLANLYTRILAGKTKFIVDKNLRTYQDMIYGKSCYSEIVGFKISKRIKGNEAVLQSYYFENNDSELLEFVDTQVKNSTVYDYDIFYYVAVLGNLYSYAPYEGEIDPVVDYGNLFTGDVPPVTSVNGPRGNRSNTSNASPAPSPPPSANADSGGQQITRTSQGLAVAAPPPPPAAVTPSKFIRVINRPLLHIFEIRANNNINFPSYGPTVVSVAPVIRPPLAPIVTPIPFKDDRKRIRFNFMQNIGKYKEKFIRITPNDLTKRERTFLEHTQDPITFAQGIIEFETEQAVKIDSDSNGKDETVAQVEDYQIFRTENAPLSYADFSDKLLYTIDNKTINNQDPNATPTTTYDDFLEPNKKYYYTFRSLNSIGLKSNPTEVYEIELVINSGDKDFENSGAYYPIIRVYNFPEESGVSKERAFKQYFRLKAAFEQKLVKDISTLESTAQFKLGDGIANPPVWGKNFKIRLTSKQTSRKIDINFKLTNIPKK